jgi:L-iditol 2-dehydrogenase
MAQNASQYSIPAAMRALVLDGVGFEHLSVRSVPTPRPGPKQLLARVDAASICTSLIKLIEQGSEHSLVNGWDITRFPLILGDEGSVTLVEVGSDLHSTYRVGERYVVQPAVDVAPINYRERYRNNAQGIVKVAAGYTLPGNLAEYILIPEEVLAAGCLLPVPGAHVPYAHASLSEPLSCAVSAQDHHVHLDQETPLSPRVASKGLKRGGVTVIIGAGPMGVMHIDVALSARPRTVIVSDFIAARLHHVRDLFAARAEALGVKLLTIDASTSDMQAVVNAETDYLGADDVIVAVGVRQAIESAQHHVGRGAVLNLFGGLKKGQDIVPFDTSLIHYKEINVTGSSGGSPWDIAHTLELIAAGEINPGNHITRIGDLNHSIEFLDLIKKAQSDGKAVVYPHRPATSVLAVPQWTADDERAYLAQGER